jgi:hypothetical protein
MLVLTFFSFLAAKHGWSQAESAATQYSPPFAVGIGFSTYNMDYARGYMDGGTLWADWFPNHLPTMLNGLGLEIKAQDISLNRHSGQDKLRTDTAGGGLIYSYRRFHRIHPFVEGTVSDGSLSFDLYRPGVTYDHDTRIVYAGTFGGEIRASRRIWVRADWEYQVWPNLFRKNNALNPNGYTFGVSYYFKNLRFH